MLRSGRGREEKLMQRQARWRCGGAGLVVIEHGLVSGGWAVEELSVLGSDDGGDDDCSTVVVRMVSKGGGGAEGKGQLGLLFACELI
ncbi:hypothetical protein M0R45_019270 [Rubus argutus]|uniref:Uncharacterized protein n=1 Tax=Rubus argutus TaxID=59490 RepID=A0AAW1X6T8_RUBAR